MSETTIIRVSVDERDAIAANLVATMAALEAENAALKAGDAMLKAALKDADEQYAALKDERNAARAWAAAWKRAATGWRARGLFDALAFSNNFTRKKRLLDVARRAAEAMERQ